MYIIISIDVPSYYIYEYAINLHYLVFLFIDIAVIIL